MSSLNCRCLSPEAPPQRAQQTSQSSQPSQLHVLQALGWFPALMLPLPLLCTPIQHRWDSHRREARKGGGVSPLHIARATASVADHSTCQLDWATERPNSWLNIILGMSVRVVLAEINI